MAQVTDHAGKIFVLYIYNYILICPKVKAYILPLYFLFRRLPCGRLRFLVSEKNPTVKQPSHNLSSCSHLFPQWAFSQAFSRSRPFHRYSTHNRPPPKISLKRKTADGQPFHRRQTLVLHTHPAFHQINLPISGYMQCFLFSKQTKASLPLLQHFCGVISYCCI